jgi:hypothetical protein
MCECEGIKWTQKGPALVIIRLLQMGNVFLPHSVFTWMFLQEEFELLSYLNNGLMFHGMKFEDEELLPLCCMNSFRFFPVERASQVGVGPEN